MSDQPTPLRVLIVDDSFEDREILKRYLKKVEDYDCDIIEAKNVDEGLSFIQSRQLDLMFVDFNMPGATGLDLLEKIRRFHHSEFPIIMLTGEGSEHVAVQALKSGVGDYLIKDEITPRTIRGAIIGTLDRFKMEKTIEAQRRQLEVAARTDGLTGLWNRRYFDEQLEMELERATRYGLTLSLAMADLDRFKLVNDNYGHLVGDSVLIGFSEVLKQGLRMSDFAARYGGEEFCVIMPSINLDQAAIAFCRLMETLRNRNFRNDKGEPFRVTATAGVVELNHNYKTPESFIEAADKALYHGKNNGRDKVILINANGEFIEACQRDS